MLKSTYQQALKAIAEENKVLVLIQNSDDPLSVRARQVLYSNQVKIEKLGYRIICIDSDEETIKSAELACLYLPQIRVFKNKKLQLKHIGIPTEEFIKDIY